MRTRSRLTALGASLALALVGLPATAGATNTGTTSGNDTTQCDITWTAQSVMDRDLTDDDPVYPGLMTDMSGNPVTSYVNGGYIQEIRPEYNDPGIFEANHWYGGTVADDDRATTSTVANWRFPLATDDVIKPGATITVELPAGLTDVTFDAVSTSNQMSSWPTTYRAYTWAGDRTTAAQTDDTHWTVTLPDGLAAKTGTVFQLSGSVTPGTDLNQPAVATATLNGAYPSGAGTCPVDDADLPPLPEAPAVGQCEAAQLGRTVWSVYDSDITERDKWTTDYSGTHTPTGETNADGWGASSGTEAGATRTVRLYGATDEALTGVTYTVTATQGATFVAGSVTTVTTPGGGQLQNNGYTVAVEGVGTATISADGTTLTVTIDSMPADSSFSLNVTMVLTGAKADDGDALPIVLDHLLLGDQEGCTVVVPTEEPTQQPTAERTEEPTTSTTTPGAGATVSVAVTSAPASTTPGTSLARTGTNALIGLGAFALLVLGGSILLAVRRRSS